MSFASVCTFCRRADGEGPRLFLGDEALPPFICDECVLIAAGCLHRRGIDTGHQAQASALFRAEHPDQALG